MEMQTSTIGGRGIDGGVNARPSVGLDGAVDHALVVGAEQKDVLMRNVAQLASLLMTLTATPQVLEILPESARADVLCLACDLAIRTQAILEGGAPHF